MSEQFEDTLALAESLRLTIEDKFHWPLCIQISNQTSEQLYWDARRNLLRDVASELQSKFRSGFRRFTGEAT